MKTRSCPIIGLAGGIGSGKSTISGIFKSLGAVIIDADRIAHQVLESPEVIPAIKETFGRGVITDGKVSRTALGSIVFEDLPLLEKLNSIIHPAVIARCRELIEHHRKDPDCRAVVLDAPLIFEAGLEADCDAMVFVEASDALRQRRVAAARGWDKEELSRRGKFQDSLKSKKERADYIINNNGSLADAAAKTREVWEAISSFRSP
ncbi:MAG: dephospho-CoA kinase [Planctomycetota bacterium]|jgi:dephospho-CoA kinase